MNTERYTDKSDEELKRLIEQGHADADMQRRFANRINVQVGEYCVELDRRAVERLPLNVGDEVLRSNGTVTKIEYIGNWGAGLEYVTVSIDNKYISLDEALAMRQAWLKANPDAT